MEEVIKFTPDALLELMSYMDPCKLGEYLRINKDITEIILKPESLYKLAKDRKLPYREGITLEDLCDYYKMKLDGSLSSYMTLIGWLEGVELTMSDDGSDYGKIITDASSKNILDDIIELIIDKSIEDNVPLFFTLAYNGDKNVIKLVEDYIGEIDAETKLERLNELLRGSAASGRKKAVEYYLQKGANDLKGAYSAAIDENHHNIVQILKRYDTKNLL